MPVIAFDQRVNLTVGDVHSQFTRFFQAQDVPEIRLGAFDLDQNQTKVMQLNGFLVFYCKDKLRLTLKNNIDETLVLNDVDFVSVFSSDLVEATLLNPAVDKITVLSLS